MMGDFNRGGVNTPGKINNYTSSPLQPITVNIGTLGNVSYSQADNVGRTIAKEVQKRVFGGSGQ